MNKYEYLGQTSFCTKESKFDENGILTSYVDFFFDTDKNYLGWDQYWSAQLSGPMRLAESYKIKYNKNKKPIATSSYEHFYDSLEPKTHFEHLYLNGHNQPINYDEYNKDSTKVISSTRFKYDDNERLIYREYRHKEKKNFTIDEYQYKNNLLTAKKNTRWQSARDTVQNESVFKYDNQGNCIQELIYLNKELLYKQTRQIEYYKD
jgi:hypothetical protein